MNIMMENVDMNNVYSIDGKDFHSIKALSTYVGVNEKTITARLRKGMSIEEACAKRDFRCTYIPYKNEEKAFCAICDIEEKDRDLVRNRLRYGYSLNDALNKPKKISKQGKPIVVDGVLYNSISMACRKLGLEDKEGTIRSRLRIGKTADEAFYFD